MSKYIQTPCGSEWAVLSYNSLKTLETAIESGREIAFSYNGELVTAKPSHTFFKRWSLWFAAKTSEGIRGFQFKQIDVNEGKGIQFAIIEEGKEA